MANWKKGPTWDPIAMEGHRAIFGEPGKPSFTGVAPADLKFEELNANNTQILDANGNVRDQYKIGFDSLLPQYQTELDKIQLNTDALAKLREQALGDGESPWLAMERQNLEASLGDMRDSANAQQGSANANLLSSLAMSGGLSGGAAERASRQTNSDYNKTRQQIARYGVTTKNELSIADQKQRQALLGQVQGLEMQALQPQIMKAQANLGQLSKEQGMSYDTNKYGIQIALDELAQKRSFDLEQYKQKMAQYAADRTAHAQENSDSGGGKGGGK